MDKKAKPVLWNSGGRDSRAIGQATMNSLTIGQSAPSGPTNSAEFSSYRGYTWGWGQNSGMHILMQREV